MIDPMHFDRVSHEDVVQKWGVSADKLGDVLALAGDSSDNIPGVRRVLIFLLKDFHGRLNSSLQ